MWSRKGCTEGSGKCPDYGRRSVIVFRLWALLRNLFGTRPRRLAPYHPLPKSSSIFACCQRQLGLANCQWRYKFRRSHGSRGRSTLRGGLCSALTHLSFFSRHLSSPAYPRQERLLSHMYTCTRVTRTTCTTPRYPGCARVNPHMEWLSYLPTRGFSGHRRRFDLVLF